MSAADATPRPPAGLAIDPPTKGAPVASGVLWTMNLTTFRGSAAFGATHSYVVLQAPEVVVEHEGELYKVDGQTFQVQRVLDEEGARELRELNESFGRPYSPGVGEPTQQFDDDEQARGAALVAYRALRQVQRAAGDERPMLLLRTSGFGANGPSEPVAHDPGTANLAAALREVWQLDESETSYDWTSVREEASRRWDALDAEHGFTRVALPAGEERRPRNAYGDRYPDQAPASAVYVERAPDGEWVVVATDDFDERRRARWAREDGDVTALVVPDETDETDGDDW